MLKDKLLEDKDLLERHRLSELNKKEDAAEDEVVRRAEFSWRKAKVLLCRRVHRRRECTKMKMHNVVRSRGLRTRWQRVNAALRLKSWC